MPLNRIERSSVNHSRHLLHFPSRWHGAAVPRALFDCPPIRRMLMGLQCPKSALLPPQPAFHGAPSGMALQGRWPFSSDSLGPGRCASMALSQDSNRPQPPSCSGHAPIDGVRPARHNVTASEPLSSDPRAEAQRSIPCIRLAPTGKFLVPEIPLTASPGGPSTGPWGGHEDG